jgi:hypothetical protein
MNPELLIKMLMKFMGINEQQMRDIFDKGQSLIVDGKEKIDTIDARLRRIERALGISETNETKALTNGQRDETV